MDKTIQQICIASGMDAQDKENQVNVLIYPMGEQAEDIVVSLHLNADEAGDYGTVKDKLDAQEHYIRTG